MARDAAAEREFAALLARVRACRACADSYTALAAATGQRSMRLRAALLRIGLPAYQAFLKHKT